MATTSPSIKLIKASDGSDNASVATVQSVRSMGATTLDVDTVDGIPEHFYGSMGTPHTFVDPITSETITVISEATAVDFEGHVDGSNLEIDAISPGFVDAGSEIGDIVIIRPVSEYANNIAAVLGVAHADNGKLLAATPVEDTNFDFTVEPITGWTNDPNTFTYVSGTGTITAVFKASGVDLTGYLQAGMPFVVVQGGVKKYGFITKIAFSTDTTITALMAATNGTVDNSGITNTTITSFKFGLPKRPGFGFPLDPAKWTVTTTSTSDCAKSSPVSGTWYGDTALSPTGPSILIPIGAWNVSYNAVFRLDRTSTSMTGQISLSTSASSESDTDFTLGMGIAGASGGLVNYSGQFKSKFLTLAAATTYYLIIKASTASGAAVTIQGSTATTTLKAVCAYL